MFSSLKVLAVICLLSYVFVTAANLPLEKRQSSTGVSSAINAINTALAGVLGGVVADASEASQIFSALLTAIEDTIEDQVTATPTDIAEATSVLSSIFSASPTILYDNVVEMAANGLAPTESNIIDLVAGPFTDENSETNVNPRNPNPPAYPKRSSLDPSYTLSEAQLREVIYIPSTFTYGQKPPVIVSIFQTTSYQDNDRCY